MHRTIPIQILHSPLQSILDKDVIVQVSAYSARELRLIQLSSLTSALQNDPDLAHVNPAILPQVIQTIYVATGCDYTSFFSQIGKATFLRYFFQYSAFVTAGTDPSTPGTLACVALRDNEYKLGYLAFMRLIGTVYFKKNSSGFDTVSPATYFSQFNDHTTVEEQHSSWLQEIRQTIWYRTKFENEMIASDEALLLHWQRSCWILHMWSQADRSDLELLPMTSFGWCSDEDQLTMKWDTEFNICAIRQRVDVLTKGCKCATGCTTNRCGCKKKGVQCSAGCECFNCSNCCSHVYSASNDSIQQLAIEEEHEDFPSDVDDIVDFVFGVDDDSEHQSENDLPSPPQLILS